MRNVVYAVGVGVTHKLIVLILRIVEVFSSVARTGMNILQSPLDVLGQIDIIREVESPLALDFVDHIYVFLVLGVDSHATILSQRHKLQLLHSIDNSAHNLSDDGSLLDQDEVACFAKLDVAEDPVHCLGKLRVLLDVSEVLVNLLVVNIFKPVQLESQELGVDSEKDVVSNQRNAVLGAMKLELRVYHFPRVIRS